MNEIKSIAFTFNDATYNALVRLRRVRGKWARVVTIMNGELEALLFGNHFFFLDDEGDSMPGEKDPEAVKMLRKQIFATLQDDPQFKIELASN